MIWSGWLCSHPAALSAEVRISVGKDVVIAEASKFLAKAVHVRNKDQRGAKLSTYSWSALRLFLLIGEEKWPT